MQQIPKSIAKIMEKNKIAAPPTKLYVLISNDTYFVYYFCAISSTRNRDKLIQIIAKK